MCFVNHPFTIKVQNFLSHCKGSTRHGAESGSRLEGNVLSVAPASTVIDLVHQAAELFTGMENRARETEARAHSLCKDALERVELAEKRIETVERERHEQVNEAHSKLRDASDALEQARLRLSAAEDQARAAEFRAQAAEAKAREAKHALALVEEAIRSRFPSGGPEAINAVQ
jgi:hypothetical protein